MSSSELCRLVHLEWDRGHEEFDAIVRAETPLGIVVTELNDYTALEGLRWIRPDEITSIKDLEPEDPTARFSDLRGWRHRTESPSLTDLPSLLETLSRSRELVAVYGRRTGSDEALVGVVSRIEGADLYLAEVDTDATWTGETLDHQIDQIIGLDWGTSYLLGLAELLQANERERG